MGAPHSELLDQCLGLSDRTDVNVPSSGCRGAYPLIGSGELSRFNGQTSDVATAGGRSVLRTVENTDRRGSKAARMFRREVGHSRLACLPRRKMRPDVP